MISDRHKTEQTRPTREHFVLTAKWDYCPYNNFSFLSLSLSCFMLQKPGKALAVWASWLISIYLHLPLNIGVRKLFFLSQLTDLRDNDWAVAEALPCCISWLYGRFNRKEKIISLLEIHSFSAVKTLSLILRDYS